MISKRTAKEALEKIWWEVWKVDIPSPTVPEYVEHHKQMQCLMDLIRREINQLKDGWIPVEERLPDKPGKYLVTVKNGNVYAGTFDMVSHKFQCAATAWMELPEPYREEG